MASRLHQVLTFTGLAAGASATLTHDIRWNDRPVIPDLIFPMAGNLAFTVISCTSTQLTIRNDDTTVPGDFSFWLFSIWSEGRAFNDQATQFLAPLPFVAGGGGGGGGGGGISPTLQNFLYTVTGLEPDLTDFMVNLPAARATDLYVVEAGFAGVATIAALDFPNVLVGDRTTTQFRVVATAPLVAGDQIDFSVEDYNP